MKLGAPTRSSALRVPMGAFTSTLLHTSLTSHSDRHGRWRLVGYRRGGAEAETGDQASRSGYSLGEDHSHRQGYSTDTKTCPSQACTTAAEARRCSCSATSTCSDTSARACSYTHCRSSFADSSAEARTRLLSSSTTTRPHRLTTTHCARSRAEHSLASTDRRHRRYFHTGSRCCYLTYFICALFACWDA